MASSKIQGVALADIKSIAGAEVPQQWEVVYEVDFTTQATGSVPWSSGGGWKQTFEGIDWYAGNVAYASTNSPDVSPDGVKFVITDDESTSRWWNTTQTGPIVYADLTDILSAAGYTYSIEDTVAIQSIGEFVINVSGSPARHFYAGVYVGDGTTTAAANASGLWFHNCWHGDEADATIYSAMTRYGGGGENQGNNYDDTYSGPRPTFLELVAYPGTGWAASVSTDATFVPPLSLPNSTAAGRSYGNMELLTPKEMGCVPSDEACSDWGTYPIVYPGRNTTTTNPGSSPKYTLRPGAASSYGAAIKVGIWAAYLTVGGDARDSAITCKFTKFRVLKRNK